MHRTSYAGHENFFRLESPIECTAQPSLVPVQNFINIPNPHFNTSPTPTPEPRRKRRRTDMPWVNNISVFPVASTSLDPDPACSENSAMPHLYISEQYGFLTPQAPSDRINFPQRYLWDSELEEARMPETGLRYTSPQNSTSPILGIFHDRDAASGLLDPARLFESQHGLFPSQASELRDLDTLHDATPESTGCLLSPLFSDDRGLLLEELPLATNEEVSQQYCPIPRINRPAVKKSDVIKDVLQTLRNHNITPTGFLFSILDDSTGVFPGYQTAFYSKSNSHRLETLLDLIWTHDKGSRTMQDWLRPRAIDLVTNIVHKEMKDTRRLYHMAASQETSEDVTMESIARVTPIWRRIQNVATDGYYHHHEG